MILIAMFNVVGMFNVTKKHSRSNEMIRNVIMITSLFVDCISKVYQTRVQHKLLHR